eukprot:TRINITY_DN5523_c1_g1_i1.p1 TRINITY_DN5523_c1_g1~~TRINITY_DN5523_c1_g1_i1.p1  ORF type:complete len:375 (+),score=87.60 TRINITY_DN5523_c1_g1_i1:256-1380(+)
MASNSEALANAKYVDEEYEESLALYDTAIEEEPRKASLYSSRAQVNIKLEKFPEAISDAKKAIELDPHNAKAFFRKGMASFEMDEFESAKLAFEAAAALDSASGLTKTWIRKCNAAIEDEARNAASNGNGAPGNSSDVPRSAESAPATPAQAMERESNPAPAPEPKSEDHVMADAAPPPPKFRHEFYQSPTEVVVTVFAKSVEKEHFHVDFGEQTLHARIDLPDGDPYNLMLRLFGKIKPEKCRSVLMKSKIEIRMAKADAITWTVLEYSAQKGNAVQPINVSSADSVKKAYPSSSKRAQVDWDKLESQVKKEEKDEKLEGDAALNKLFQNIYGDSDEDTRRAMNKSFVESKGTVLSTNWKEIGAKHVTPHPPK